MATMARELKFTVRVQGVTQLAKELGISRANLSQIVNGSLRASPRMQKLLTERGYTFNAQGFFVKPEI